MTSMELLELLGSVKDSYVAEARTPVQKARTLRRPLLVAALIALALLLVGCTVAYVSGWFTDFFAARSEDPLSPEQIEYIQENEQIIQQTQAIGDWTVELKSAITDGETGYVLFTVTAPNDVDLEGYFKGKYGDSYVSPGNYSHNRNPKRSLIVASTGLSDPELNFMWQEGGSWKDDNDGLPNTLNYIVETRIERVYPSKPMLLEEPFGPDVTFTVTFDDFTLEYNDPEIQKKIDEKYADMTDYMVEQEDLVGLHKSELLIENEWKFTIPFNEVNTKPVELITGEPAMTWGIVSWKLDDEPLFYKTASGIAPVKITSFLLNPFGATITYEFEEPAYDAFIAYEKRFGYTDSFVYAVLKNGSQIAFHTDGTGNKLKAETPIVLSEVDHILLGSGETLPVPE